MHSGDPFRPSPGHVHCAAQKVPMEGIGAVSDDGVHAPDALIFRLQRDLSGHHGGGCAWMRGAHDLDELAALTEAAASEGLAAIEPAGGISFENLGPILRTCLQAAPVAVIPHIFSAVVDRATQRTSPELVHRLLEIATEVLQ